MLYSPQKAPLQILPIWTFKRICALNQDPRFRRLSKGLMTVSPMVIDSVDVFSGCWSVSSIQRKRKTSRSASLICTTRKAFSMSAAKATRCYLKRTSTTGMSMMDLHEGSRSTLDSRLGVCIVDYPHFNRLSIFAHNWMMRWIMNVTNFDWYVGIDIRDYSSRGLLFDDALYSSNNPGFFLRRFRTETRRETAWA